MQLTSESSQTTGIVQQQTHIRFWLKEQRCGTNTSFFSRIWIQIYSLKMLLIALLMSAYAAGMEAKSIKLELANQGFDQVPLYKNVLVPENWKTDNRYENKWKGEISNMFLLV